MPGGQFKKKSVPVYIKRALPQNLDNSFCELDVSPDGNCGIHCLRFLEYVRENVKSVKEVRDDICKCVRKYIKRSYISETNKDELCSDYRRKCNRQGNSRYISVIELSIYMREMFPTYNFIVLRKNTKRFNELLGEDWKYVRKDNRYTILFLLKQLHFTILCKKDDINPLIPTSTVSTIANLKDILGTETDSGSNPMDTLLQVEPDLMENLGCYERS